MSDILGLIEAFIFVGAIVVGIGVLSRLVDWAFGDTPPTDKEDS